MSLPVWTAYAQEMALRYVLGLTPATAPTNYWFALFSTSADPALGVSTNECADASYARQQIHWNTSGTTLFQMATTGSPEFTFAAAGSFGGVRIMDSSTISAGNTLWWQDLDSNYEYDAGAIVPLLAAAISVGLSNPS